MNIEFFGTDSAENDQQEIARLVRRLAVELNHRLPESKYKEYALMKLLDTQQACVNASVSCYINKDESNQS